MLAFDFYRWLVYSQNSGNEEIWEEETLLNNRHNLTHYKSSVGAINFFKILVDYKK